VSHISACEAPPATSSDFAVQRSARFVTYVAATSEQFSSHIRIRWDFQGRHVTNRITSLFAAETTHRPALAQTGDTASHVHCSLYQVQGPHAIAPAVSTRVIIKNFKLFWPVSTEGCHLSCLFCYGPGCLRVYSGVLPASICCVAGATADGASSNLR
jgi:hypothetical protein